MTRRCWAVWVFRAVFPPRSARTRRWSHSCSLFLQAIKSYNGGVVVISHNREFTSTVCPEEWLVGGGECKVVGAAYDLTKRREKIELKQQEEITDAFGNTIKVKAPKKKLSRKESKVRRHVLFCCCLPFRHCRCCWRQCQACAWL